MQKSLLPLTLLATALLMAGCTTRQQPLTDNPQFPRYWYLPPLVANPASWADSVKSYRQQACNGSGLAYLKLAHCYHKGLGVQRDYLTMVAMVELSTPLTGITMKEFTAKLPDRDDYRLIYTGIEAALANDDETAWLCITGLESMGYDSEAEIIRCFRADTTTDCHVAIRDFYRTASKEDCALKQVFACLGAVDAGDYAFVSRRLPRLAETSPALWVSLGHLYTRYGAIHNDSLAAHYYAKADEYALLPPMERRWLADYRQRVKAKCTLTQKQAKE